MRRLLIWILLLQVNMVVGQSSSDKVLLEQKEDSLKEFAREIIWAEDAESRFRADSFFTRILVRALVIPHSFHFPFDSIIQISRLYAPDSAFRIFTWQVMKDQNLARRHGAIQMRSPDGKLVLFPLLENSASIQDPLHEPASTNKWIGSIYYKIIMKEFEGKKLYTLFGYDENDMASTMKRLEVLQFNSDGKPVFGGAPYFSFAQDSVKKPDQVRFWIEYKKEGNARLQYDEELGMILYDHLIPESGDTDKKYTYIPDGDYEGFTWENGKWVHIDKVFNFALQDGQAPVPVPLNENKLNIPPPSKNKQRKKKN